MIPQKLLTDARFNKIIEDSNKKVVYSVFLVYVTRLLNYMRCFPFSGLALGGGMFSLCWKGESNYLTLEMVFYSLFWRPQLLPHIHTLSELVSGILTTKNADKQSAPLICKADAVKRYAPSPIHELCVCACVFYWQICSLS